MKKTKGKTEKTLRKNRKGFKIALIIVGVVIVGIGSLVGVKLYDVQQKGMNIFTGEMTGDAKAMVEANSLAPDLQLDTTEMFTDRDLLQNPDTTDARTIELESGQDVTLNDEGIYVVSGDYTDTMILIEADDKESIQLVFDGLNISNQDKPVVYVKSGDKVFITMTDSENSLGVTGDYRSDDDTNLDAVIFSKSDIVFNGIGSLVIDSTTGNGVSSKDDLKITGGSYRITALEDGLEANDSVRIYDGVIEIISDNDAIHAENDEDDALGYVYIEGGDLNIVAGDDAIRGNSAVVIDGGSINIEECQEGLEASQIIINDGELSIYSTDDGINATFKTSYRAMIEVNGGVVNVAMASGDTDGFDSNGDLTINGGEINIVGGMAAFDVDGIIAFNAGDVQVDGVAQTEIKTQVIGFGSKFNRN